MKYISQILILSILAVGFLSDGHLYAQSLTKTAVKSATPQLINKSNPATTGTIIATPNMKSNKVSNYTAKANSDSTTSNSRITKIWNSNERYFVEVILEDKNAVVELVAYNMFGKNVQNIDDIIELNSTTRVYSFNATSLPNGVYLCVLQGRNIRDVEKFIVSR